jgi:hypothetical protein
MPIINSYPQDVDIQDQDAWIGTDYTTKGTKQYTAEAVANYLNQKGKVSIAGQVSYKFVNTPFAGQGTMALSPNNGSSFSAITGFKIAKADLSGQGIQEYLDYLVGREIIIVNQNDPNSFGHYSIYTYTVDDDNDQYYDLVVTFLGGNGSITVNSFYSLANFTFGGAASTIASLTNIGIGNVNPSTYPTLKGLTVSYNNGTATIGLNIQDLPNTAVPTSASDILVPWAAEVSGVTYNSKATLQDLIDDTGVVGGPYLPLTGGIMTGTNGVSFPDNFNLNLGTSGDFRIFYNGNNAILQNTSGDIVFENTANDRDIFFKSDDGSGGVENYIQIDGSEGRTLFNKHIRLNDDIKAQFGGSADLEIYHSGSHSYITNDTGNFEVTTTGSLILQDASANKWLMSNQTGNVLLYSAGSVKLSTTNTGITITGAADFNSAGRIRLPGGHAVADPDINFTGATAATGFSRAGQDITFIAGGAEKMRLDSSGNVGINTTNPSDKLHVVGSALIEGSGTELKVKGSGSYDTANIVMGNAAKSDSFSIDTRNDPGGNYTTLSFDSYQTTGTSTITLGDNYVNLGTAGSSRVTINSSGNVGIGTTSPAAKLDIESTTSGVLLPRMTTAQVNAISSPSNGLTVYNTTLNTLCFYNGSSWWKVSAQTM